MDKPALQTPKLDPRLVINACAYSGLREDLLQLGIYVEVTQEGWSLLVRNERNTKDAVSILCDHLQIKRKSLTQIEDHVRLGVQARPLGAEMISYLVRRDWSNGPDAQPIHTEKMIVASMMPNADLISLLDRINAHATCCRAAVFHPPTGTSFVLFHLRDDAVRGSSLRSFLRAYKGLKAPILNAYNTEYGTVFLPVAPPREALNAVATLIDCAPQLFGFSPNMKDGWLPETLLFAVTRAEDLPNQVDEDIGSERNDFYFDTRKARFFGSAVLTEALRPRMISAVPLANPSQDLADLQERLRDPDGEFAFPLRLQADKTHLLSEHSRSQLAEMKAEQRVLEVKINHLNAGLIRQSILVVLPVSAFGDMMVLLRKTVADIGTWDGIKYRYVTPDWKGFEALAPHVGGAEENDGLHVFHFDATLAEKVRLQSALSINKDISFFWGDPSWTAIYGRKAQIEIVVPLRTSLTPVPHSWEADRMDRYLCDMVSMWSKGEIDLNFSEPHVLMFYRPLGAAADALDLVVFEAGDFRELSGDTITWFNAVQVHSARSAETQALLEEADALDFADIQTATAHRADDVKEHLNAEVEALQSFATQSIKDFQTHIDAELATLFDTLTSRSEKIEELEKMSLMMEGKYKYAKNKLDGAKTANGVFEVSAKGIIVTQQKEMDFLLKIIKDRENVFVNSAKETEAKINAMKQRLHELAGKWF